MEKNSLTLKPKIKILTFQLSFVQEAYLRGLVLLSPREVSYKENVHCFLVGFKAIEKTHILNSYKYLIVKYNLK